MAKRKKPPKPMGRRPLYTDKLSLAVCAEIATSHKGLRTICKMKGMPSVETVLRWLRSKPDFCALYARAKAEQVELLVEDSIEIADDGRNDTFSDEDGNVIVNTDVIQRSKLRIDTRKWLASKLLPRKYGEQLNLNHAGQIDGHLSTTAVSEEKWLAIQKKKQLAIEQAHSPKKESSK